MNYRGLNLWLRTINFDQKKKWHIPKLTNNLFFKVPKVYKKLTDIDYKSLSVDLTI